MAQPEHQSCFKLALLLTAPLLMTACAYAGGITPQEAAIQDQVEVGQYMPATRDMRDNIETQELFAQAAFWSHEYDLNPSDLEATLKLAAAVRKLGNPGRAVEITQMARSIHPRDPYLLAEHSAALIADQRALDAIPVLDQGLRITQGYGRLWSLKGAALDQMEEYETARQNYNRALQITPNDPNVLTNLGLSYALSGDLRSAEVWLRRAAAMPDAGSTARENLAMMLQLQGRTEEAERELRLAGLSRGERRLPPAPVPALTPRGTPAQLSGSTSGGIPQRSVPTQGYQTRGYPNQNAPSAYSGSQAYQGQTATPPPGSYNAQMGGVPATRLTTTAPNGQSFTSSSQAARQSAGSLDQYESVPARNYGAPTHYGEQQDVLNSIRQSLKPGAVTPDAQPYVVGPRVPAPQTQYQQQSPQSGYPAQPQSGYPQQGYAPQPPTAQNYLQQPYPQQPYTQPQAQPSSESQSSRGAARRRR